MFFTEGVLKHWNKFPREVIEPPSLEVFKRCRALMLRGMVQSYVMVGLNDLDGLFSPK